MDATMPPQVSEEWSSFESLDAGLLRGLDVYDPIFQSGWLFPLQRKLELAEMMRRARILDPKVVMEIGSDKGGGFYHWIKSLPTVSRAIAVEHRGTPFAPSFQRMFPDLDLLTLSASSYDPSTVAQVRRFLAEDRIDCLFLDGDKSAFEKDFAVYSPLVRSGGLVFVHDVADNISPRRFFFSLRDRYRLEVLIDCREATEALARAAAGTTAANAHESWLRHWGITSCQVGVVHL